MATAETVMAVTSYEDRALESRMRSKDSCPVWGGGAGKVPNWQLAYALLYRTSGSVRGARGNSCPLYVAACSAGNDISPSSKESGESHASLRSTNLCGR